MQEFEFNQKMMGTTLSLSIVTESAGLATMIAKDVIERLKKYELQFSRFLPKSELSRLNHERTLEVFSLFIGLLETAKGLSKRTNGYFNPLLQVSRLGYSETFDALKGARMLDEHPYNINMDDIVIDHDTSTVTLVSDQQLDFGGFLKGYLAESEARRIMSENPAVQGVIVNLGGDLYTRGRDAHGERFIFEIENPVNKTLIPVTLENIGLATSGTYKRSWTVNRGTMHHILARDGTTNPDSTVVSASVIHEHGATAEAYAKSLLSVSPKTLEDLTGESLRYARIHTHGIIENTL